MWQKIKDHCSAILLIAAFLGTAAGGHAYFAKSADLDALTAAYQFDKTTQRYNAVQERIWRLEEMCKKSGCANHVQDEIKKLKLELRELERELGKKS